MKSDFLKHLANLLITDRETDFIEIYNLQHIKNWPLLTIVHYDSETDKSVESILVEDIAKYKPEDLELLGLENCEIIDLTEERFIVDACGDSQPPQRLTIKLIEGEIMVSDCIECPEAKEEDYTEESLEEYEKYINRIQEILENQD